MFKNYFLLTWFTPSCTTKKNELFNLFWFSIYFYSLMLFDMNVIFLHKLVKRHCISSQHWMLMAWCFSTRPSAATILSTHPCISSCLWVDQPLINCSQEKISAYTWIDYWMHVAEKQYHNYRNLLMVTDHPFITGGSAITLTAFNTYTEVKAVTLRTFSQSSWFPSFIESLVGLQLRHWAWDKMAATL